MEIAAWRSIPTENATLVAKTQEPFRARGFKQPGRHHRQEKLKGSELMFAALRVYAEAFATCAASRITLLARYWFSGLKAWMPASVFGANASRVDANHRIFLSAEATDPGLVDRKRNRLDGITHVHAAGHCAGACGE